MIKAKKLGKRKIAPAESLLQTGVLYMPDCYLFIIWIIREEVVRSSS
ncbi:hypothetical protein [Methanosarcina siciliae]|nr:hypothetical protein [Methanosarcina siciliae]